MLMINAHTVMRQFDLEHLVALFMVARMSRVQVAVEQREPISLLAEQGVNEN